MKRAVNCAATCLAAVLLTGTPGFAQYRLGQVKGEVKLLGANQQDENTLIGILAVTDFAGSGTVTAQVHANKLRNNLVEYLAEFIFPGLLPGFYTFVVTARHYTLRSVEKVEVKASNALADMEPKPIEVRFPQTAGWLGDTPSHLPLLIRLLREPDAPQAACPNPWPVPAGKVTLAGRPVSGVQITIAAWDGAAGVFQNIASQTTGPDGAYSVPLDVQKLQNLGSTEYILIAQLKGYQPEVRIVRSCEASPSEIVLQPLVPEKRGVFSTTEEAAYRFVFSPYLLESLPIPGIRTFDYLSLLAPGVVAPPVPWTRAGAGIAPGVGTPGQFIVNGLRGRENNFAIDGGDDNDEELGVRRQGFVALAPQPMESIAELQVISTLADARYGRSIGAQVNAITASGAASFHGGVFGSLTDNIFNARDYFTHNLAAGKPGPVLRSPDAPVTLDGQPVLTTLPASGNDPFLRTQTSATLSGPIHKPGSFFFISYENLTTSAQQETHFAVPTVAERGVNGTGETGFSALQIYPNVGFNAFTPASIPGNAIFSLFPFPNDPSGPYGPNTWTTRLPADQHANQVAAKTDHRAGNVAFSFRYNLTHESSDLPTVDNAIYSTIRPLVTSQSVAAYADIAVRPNIESSFRASFATTSMSFDDPDGRSPLPSTLFPSQPFLLNAPLLLNVSQPGGTAASYVSAASTLGKSLFGAAGVPGSPTSETITGPLGEVLIDGFSPVGVDTYHFPQQRNDHTYQIANLTTAVWGRHTFQVGFDSRFILLRSDNPRNSLPLAVFNGVQGTSFFGPSSPYTSAASMAAMGVTTQMDQTLAGAPLPPLRLGSVQLDLFATDDIAITPRLQMQMGIRYGRSPLPYDEDQVISRNFDYQSLASQVQQAESACVPACPGLLQNVLNAFPGNYNSIFGAHPSSVDGRWGAAWDVTGNGSTIFRAGAATYTGGFPALIVTESRSGFPWALPLNMANLPSYLGLNPVTVQAAVARSPYLFNLANPAVRAMDSRLEGIWQDGTLNLVNVPSTNGVPNSIALLSGSLADAYPILQPVQPQLGLRHPWSLQYDYSIEQRFGANNLLRVSYVGTQGRHLLRVTSPDTAPARSVLLYGGALATYSVPKGTGSTLPVLPVFSLGDLGPNPVGATAEVNGIAVKPTVFETSGSSSYNSLQVDFRHRYSKRLVLGSAFTWSHSIDNASEIFNDQTGYAYPQDSAHGSERASSDFDSRLRWITYFVFDLPEVRRNWLLRGWHLSGVYTAQSGNPYTVISSIDVNGDGILTDRPDMASGIVPVHSSNPAARIAIAPGLTALQLLAPPGTDGSMGRNSFVSWGLDNLDAALERTVPLRGDRSALAFRFEAFNALNRTQFAPPERILEAPGFGSAFSTMLPARRLQFTVRIHF